MTRLAGGLLGTGPHFSPITNHFSQERAGARPLDSQNLRTQFGSLPLT
jgi:hypothetical protein